MLKKYYAERIKNYSFLYGDKKCEKLFRIHMTAKILCILMCVIAEVMIVVFKGFEKTDCIAVAILILIVIIVPELQIVQKVKKKKEMLKYGLADFMDRVSILLDSGMTLWSALSSVAVNSDPKEPFSAEMLHAVQSFFGNDGYIYRPEECLEQLADRCSALAVSSFVSTVIQNSRKGSEELSSIFKTQSVTCRTEQRNMAKKRAEEASTLLLIPTAIVFVAILALVATPAVITVVSGLGA